jgi:hypothetical protein
MNSNPANHAQATKGHSRNQHKSAQISTNQHKSAAISTNQQQLAASNRIYK